MSKIKILLSYFGTLFPSIPIGHVIPDILHLYLRICDALINLITELRRLDGIDKSKLQTLDRSTATHVATYERILCEERKISFYMYVNKEPKALKWRDLTRPEKCSLFCFPGFLKLQAYNMDRISRNPSCTSVNSSNG